VVTFRRAGILALALALVVPGSGTAAAAPRRIVSLSPTATEDLFAIGAGKQVVAVDNDSNYPPTAPQTKLSGYTPNAEAIAAYKPDLVVISNDLGGIRKALARLHIRVLLEPAAATLADAYGQIEALGAATGHARQAASLVARMRRQIAAIAAALPRPSRPLTVFHELDPTLYSATSKTFIGRIYALLGLKDIADAARSGNGYPQLSSEYVIGARPDLIVLADGQTPAQVAKRSGWSSIPAVQQHDILSVDPDLASRWGPRIVDFVRVVAGRVKAIVTTGGRHA